MIGAIGFSPFFRFWFYFFICRTVYILSRYSIRTGSEVEVNVSAQQ